MWDDEPVARKPEHISRHLLWIFSEARVYPDLSLPCSHFLHFSYIPASNSCVHFPNVTLQTWARFCPYYCTFAEDKASLKPGSAPYWTHYVSVSIYLISKKYFN